MNLITDDSKGLRQLRAKLKATDRYGLDFETTSITAVSDHCLEHDLLRVVGAGFGFPDGTRTYVPMAHRHGKNAPEKEVHELLTEVLSDPTKELVAHNLKYEYMVCRALGITPKNKLRCSMIAQWMLGYRLDKGRGLKLKSAVQHFLNHTMTTWEEVVPKGCRAEDTVIVVMGDYCSDDALQCLRLLEHFIPEMVALELVDVYQRLEMEFLPVLVHMQECGMRLDLNYLRELHTHLSAEAKRIADEFEELVGVGVSKNQKISKRLYEELGWWPSQGFERGKAGYFSIDKIHLARLARKLEKGTSPMRALELKRRYQVISKLNSTYTLPLITRAEIHLDKRLRGSFHQAGTETGRLSSSKPNLQNIPSRSDEGRKIRDAFIAEDGWILCVADYSQADLVMMAHLSQDPMLLHAYREGIDLHQQTADKCSEAAGIEVTRPTGKTLNLGIIYEMQPKTLSVSLGVDYDIAEAIHRAWHATYPLVGVYHRRMHAYAQKHKLVRTITGRIRRIPEINSKNHMRRSMSEKMATNTPDQGSVADVIKIAKRNLLKEWQEKGVLYDYYTGEGLAKILSQVHDEIICEFKLGFEEEGMADVQRHMEYAVELRAPMTAVPGIGRSWNDAKADCKRQEKALEEARAGA